MFCCQQIERGTTYLKSTHKCDGDVYTFKTHNHCADIASKLKMYDNCDEGLTTEGFLENIKNEYQEIMSSTQQELYESKDFVYPKFAEQLQFVMNHHGINRTSSPH